VRIDQDDHYDAVALLVVGPSCRDGRVADCGWDAHGLFNVRWALRERSHGMLRAAAQVRQSSHCFED
jgi:hypothetical protein